MYDFLQRLMLPFFEILSKHNNNTPYGLFSAIRQIKREAPGIISACLNPSGRQTYDRFQDILTSVKITDLSGRLMLEISKPKSGRKFNLNSYPPGIYLVKVKTAAGKSQALKIIKQ